MIFKMMAILVFFMFANCIWHLPNISTSMPYTREAVAVICILASIKICLL